MKALVTGANGFTGSYLTKNLLKRGYSIKALVRRNSNLDSLNGLPIEFFHADLAKDSLDGLMDDIDIVFHIAAAYRIENVPHKYFWDVNVEGTRKLLQEAKKANVKRFVHSSTVGVQGEIKNPLQKRKILMDLVIIIRNRKLKVKNLHWNFFKKKVCPEQSYALLVFTARVI